MAFNPQRNWGKIYNQMWNISMCEPINRTNNTAGQGGFKSKSFPGAAAQSSGGSTNVTGQKTKPKLKYCWAFSNKGNCSDPKCHFVSKCSYCESNDHGLCNCPKAKTSGTK